MNKGYDPSKIHQQRNNMMCNKWHNNKAQFTLAKCHGMVEMKQDGDFHVKGAIDGSAGKMVVYWAANSPDYRVSYSGSGLPFPNPEVAFEDTENRGIVKAREDGTFDFMLKYPNSYYTEMGTKLNPPQVHFKICDSPDDMAEIHTLILGNGTPFRTLNHHQFHVEKGHHFHYNPQLPIRTQEQMLRDSGYPRENIKITADNFWGMRNPH